MHNTLMFLTIAGSLAVIVGVAWVEFKLDSQASKDETDQEWTHPE